MVTRAALRSSLPILLAAAGCQCGEDTLGDASPRLSVTPLSLDFGEVVLGQLRILPLTVANIGGSGLTIETTTIAGSRELSLATALPALFASQQKVDLGVAYEPADLGEDLGQLTLEGNDDRGPIVVSLRGVGVEARPGVTLDGDTCGAPGSLSFGNVVPGNSAERHITVKAEGGAPLTVLSAVVEPGSSGEWSIDASALPKTLAPGEEVVLTARYAPADGGSDSGAFIITTDAFRDGSVRVPACGTGVAPALCARPVPLDLGAVAEGQTGMGRMTLESCGLEPLVILAIALSRDAQHASDAAFRLVGTATVPVTLAPGEAVEVAIAYDAAMPVGARQAWLQVDANITSAPNSYFPIIARTASPCSLFVAPGTLAYRNVAVGMSATKAALIGNSGESACTIAGVTITSTAGAHDFALASPSMPFTLAPGDARPVEVAFAPTRPGLQVADLVATDAGGATFPVALRGNPPAPAGCAIDVTPSIVNFGITPVGTTAHLAVRVEAIGDDPCRVSAARLRGGAPFAVTLPPLRTAFPNVGGVNIDLAFSPTMAGQASDLLTLDYAAVGGMGSGSVTVGVAGTAGDARICVTPSSIDFGTVAQGSTAARNVVIESCGAAALDLRGVVLSMRGGPFSITQAPSVPQRIAAGANATPALTVTYAPTDAGPDFGQVELLSNDGQRPRVSVPLTGNFAGNCDRILHCAPTNAAFGDTEIGTSKFVRVVCRSLGSQPVSVSGVTLSGSGPEVSVLAQTPVLVPPGTAWTFDVRYQPGTTAAVSGVVSIVSNACEGTRTAQVSGQGIMRELPPCQPPSTFAPRVQWAWHSTSVEPTFTNVWSTPLVANLDDDDMDGQIDENDIPDVVFISLDTYSFTDPGASVAGVLRVLSGDTGREKFSVTSPRFADTSIPAIGDLDGDGRPEIVGFKWTMTPQGTGMGGFFGRYVTGTLVALDNTGQLLWESDPWSWPQEVSFNAGAPAIADLDGDGFAEIVLGRDVFDHNGRLLWRGTGSYGLASAGAHSIVADIDLDGHPEVIAGGTVYRGDGSILWQYSAVREGGTAVGMLDPLDPFPQIALDTGTSIVVLDHLGMVKWSNPITSMGPATMLPTIADFDGDGDGDIAVADGEQMHVFNGTGGQIWGAPVDDPTCCAGISAFDFEGDHAYELILHDNGTVYAYRGTDGQRIYRADRVNPTAFEMPVVADVDNDGKGELVVAQFGGTGVGGVVAYSNVGDTWVGAPRIFNQQAFNVRNVYESGRIPRVELPLNQGANVFRATSAACR